ncbi:MAG TPA: glycoside hydrolase family 3 N-terminal domain-containing protein [Acidimicrobiales bacterium]|nr:glycoside hydrolase family 3 N-terminal domain-containing protein [Acidimicrobiales bacterium]
MSAWPLAEKVALLLVPPVLDFQTASEQVAASDGVGGILFLGDAQPPAGLAQQLAAAFAHRGAPVAPMVMADEEGGGVQRLAGAVTSLPWPRVMAETLTPQQVQQMAATVGSQMRALGVNVDLAPVLDVDGGEGPNASDPDGYRSFSAVPAVAAQYGTAFADGLESAGVLAVAKHFPGLGGASRNTDYGPATTQPIQQLEAGGLDPFRAAIAGGIGAVMVSNASVPGLTTLPASLSPAVITGLLRGQLGFQGLVMTDSLSAGAISQSGYDLPHAVVAAVAAGADMVLFGSTLTPAQTALQEPSALNSTIQQLVGALVAAVDGGTLPLSRVNDAVIHIVTADHADLCT